MFDLQFVKSLPAQVRLTDGTIGGDELYLSREWENEKCHSKLENRSDKPICVKEVALLYGKFPIAASCPFYSEGFHLLSQHGGTLHEPHNIGKYGHDEDFFELEKSLFSPDTYTAYSFILLSPTQLDRALIGFSSCHKFLGEVRFNDNYIEIVMDCENIELRPSEIWNFEELCVYFSENRDKIFESFAKQLSINHPRRKYPEIPFGWCSYHAITGVKENEMYEQARAMHERIPELKRIQIDAGYSYYTDWLVPNPETGNNMKEICHKIREIGCEAAGYISPFIVSYQSHLFHDHPDWLVMDENGKPTNEHCFNKEWYILDGTNPEAVDYIRHVVRVFHDEWGIRYFKFDFTSYGALPGIRHDRHKTRAEAFRAIFEAINEEIGNDSYILGCNAPFWAQLGLVDGNRETNDIFRRWSIVRGNMEELMGRSWQNGRLWINDPDGVVLEKRDRSTISDGRYLRRICELDDNEFEYHKAYIVACGGVVTSGDKLDEISDKNIDILRRMMAVAGDAAVYDDDSFEIGRIETNDKNIICIFNHEDDMKSIAVPLKTTVNVYDFWTDKNMGEYEGHITMFDMPPHSARVLRLKEIK